MSQLAALTLGREVRTLEEMKTSSGRFFFWFYGERPAGSRP